MKRLLILLLLAVFALIPNFVSQARAQQVSSQNETNPATKPSKDQQPQEAPAPETNALQTGLTGNYRQLFVHQPQHSWGARRTLSFTDKHYANDSLTEFITAVAASRKNKLALAPTGMMIDSGLSYSLPFGQHFSAFAAFQPTATEAFINAPQTMWAAGFQIPVNRTADGQDLSLKFATTVDQQYRPIFFFSLNLMSIGRSRK